MAARRAARSDLENARRAFDWALIALFVAALGAPTLDAWLRPLAERTPARRELRKPVEWPAAPASAAQLARYPPQLDTWFKDRMGLRDRLLRLRSRVRALGFGVSPLDEIDVTPQRWTFLRIESSREAWEGRLPLSDERLRAWETMLSEHAEVSRALGARQLFFFGPNKETIYPERVPSTWHKFGPSRLEQLTAFLDARGTNSIVDLRGPLAAAKSLDRPDAREFVYAATGTHWTPRGDHVAYATMHARLRELFPSLSPLLPFDELELTPIGGEGESWANRAFLEDEFAEPFYAVRLPHPARHIVGEYGKGLHEFIALGPDPKAPRAVLFHDSFGARVSELLAPHFSRIHCVWSGRYDANVVARERPDVVIELYVERLLVTTDPRGDRIQSEPALALRRALAPDPVFTLTRELAERDALCGPGLSSHAAGAPGALLRLRVESERGYLILPPLREPASALSNGCVVHVELLTLGETELTLLPVLRGETAPRAAPAVTAPLVSGWNDVVLRVPRIDDLERFALQPGRLPGRYVLYSFEVRPLRDG